MYTFCGVQTESAKEKRNLQPEWLPEHKCCFTKARSNTPKTIFFHRVNTIHLLLWWTIRAHVTTEKHFQKCTEIFSMRLNGSFSSCFALNDYLWTQLQITFCTFYTKKWNENNSTCFIFLFGEQTLNGFAPDKVFKLGKEIANFDCGFFCFLNFCSKINLRFVCHKVVKITSKFMNKHANTL